MPKLLSKNRGLSLLIGLLLLLALFLVLAAPAQAAGNKNSDRADTLFVYADDINGVQVLLKAISYNTLSAMSHGSDPGDPSSTYSQSYIDSMPTPAYKEGVGVTIAELLEYVQQNSTVAGVSDLTYSSDDKLYFTSTDGANLNRTYTALLGVERYYYPGLFDHWDSGEGTVSEEYLTDVLNGGIVTDVYLATESLGGRVLAADAGNNGSIADYITANDGIVAGCLSKAGLLTSDEAFTLCFGQTAAELENATPTYGNVKKWVYMVRLKESGTSPITSLGVLPDPTCVFTLDGSTLTIALSCPDDSASIYYSTVGGSTTAPLNLYDGQPIVVEDYDVTSPFNLGVQAVREGYTSSNKLVMDSANIADDPEAPSFEFSLSKSGSPEVGTPFSVTAALSADKDCPLYGAEYRLSIPADLFSLTSVSGLADGWAYGLGGDSDAIVVTFTYLDINGGQILTAETPLDIATLNLTPKDGGETAISVTSAIITRDNAVAYQGVTAEGLDLTISGSATLIGDTNGDGKVNSLDAIRLAKHLAHSITLAGYQLTAADTNGDASVNSLDAIRLAKYLAHSISGL